MKTRKVSEFGEMTCSNPNALIPEIFDEQQKIAPAEEMFDQRISKHAVAKRQRAIAKRTKKRKQRKRSA